MSAGLPARGAGGLAPAAQPRAVAAAEEPLRLGRVSAVGLLVIAGFFGILGGWAATVPLDSAAAAPGLVRVQGERKTVAHLEGGIVAVLPVREGAQVRAGDALLHLDDAQARSRLDLLRSRAAAALARLGRLRAERDGLEQIAFPPELDAYADLAGTAEARSAQRGVFAARLEAVRSEADVLGQRIAQSREEITGLREEIAALDRQRVLLKEEIAGLETLYAKRLTPKERLLSLKREEADIAGRRARAVAAIAQAQQAIAEQERRISQLSTTRLNEAVAAIDEVEATLFGLRQEVRAAEDVLRRLVVTAPVDGRVVDLRLHTTGGVVRPGEPLLDIVPSGERLIVEARVNPQDVDMVEVGQTARIMFAAFGQRQQRDLIGRLEVLSADRLEDERTGQSYYLAQIALPDAELAGLGGLVLQPGMQATVLIRSGEHTLLAYLMEPLLRRFEGALRDR